jgi:orotidine-5'-phosphate decarboxylase
MTHFADRLAEAVRKKGNPLCVGLDPRWALLPWEFRDRHADGTLTGAAAAIEAFCLKVLDLVATRVPVVKPQSAFFEALGPPGLAAMQAVIRRAKTLGLVVILDAKRGDIASTAEAYADAAFAGTSIDGKSIPVWDADALTVNPYLGGDAIEPFLRSARRSGRGLFVLVRTSNPGGGLFQDLDCGGRKVYQHIAAAVESWGHDHLGACGFSEVGAVVGATRPEELASLRRELPSAWFLVPGYGAQGADANDVAGAFRPDGLGGVVNSSRGITSCFHRDDRGWERAVVTATDRATTELAAVMKG